METFELLLTSCRQTQQWSACLWNYSTGSILHYYKNGGVVAPKSLNFIGKDYIFTSDEEKPLTHVWPLNSQEPTKKFSTVLPDKAQVLTVCPKSSYIAAGIGAKLYVWQLNSGKLLSVQKKHFQPITCVKFSSCGFYVVVAGQDGMLIVYDLVHLVSLDNSFLPESDIGQVEPIYTKHDHSMPITDVHMGDFGHWSKFATVSIDHTCKIYTLFSGELHLTLVFDEPLTAVIFDGPCLNLYVGMNSGKIQQFLLSEPVRGEHHVSNDLTFEGHKKRVTSLDINMFNSNLVSGSDDHFVYIWEIQSRQIVKVIEHKAEITNVRFVSNFTNFFTQDLKPRTVIKNLEREVIDSDDYFVSIMQNFDIELSDEEDEWKEKASSSSSSSLEAENRRLRAANKDLYEAAMKISQKYNKFE